MKRVVHLYQMIYFPFTVVKNKHHLDFKGPGIILSNHPNTLMDPMHVVSRTPRQAFFLANSGLFNTRVTNFIFSQLYCIPIQRPGLDKTNKRVDNANSLNRSHQHLSKGGVIYIAPEGLSEVGRTLRPLKTGAARIALAAEAENNFQLGVHFYPSGLNYEHPTQCGSRLYLAIGEPIRISDWKEAYEQDPFQAARQLTDHLSDELKKLLIHTTDKEQDQLLYRIERILQNDIPLAVDQHFHRTKRLLQGIQHLQATDDSTYQQLINDTHTYRTTIKDNGLTDEGISFNSFIVSNMFIVPAWPIWLYGRLNNFLAYETPRWLERKMGLYDGFKTTVKVAGGLITFPLFYYLQYLLFKSFISTEWAWAYLISLPISGVISWLYAKEFRRRKQASKWNRWSKKQPQAAQQILQLRQKIKKHSLELLGHSL